MLVESKAIEGENAVLVYESHHRSTLMESYRIHTTTLIHNVGDYMSSSKCSQSACRAYQPTCYPSEADIIIEESHSSTNARARVEEAVDPTNS